MEVPGGWLRINPRLGRADAHCAKHRGCKFDRGLKFKTLGLSLCWLSEGHEVTMEEHQVAKEIVSERTYYEKRKACRAAFTSNTAAMHRALVTLEKCVTEESGAVDEPVSLYCRSIVPLIR